VRGKAGGAGSGVSNDHDVAFCPIYILMLQDIPSDNAKPILIGRAFRHFDAMRDCPFRAGM
jgi:hypothetical protein